MAVTTPATTVGFVIGFDEDEDEPPLLNVPPPPPEETAAELDNVVVALAIELDAFCAADTAIFCITCNLWLKVEQFVANSWKIKQW